MKLYLFIILLFTISCDMITSESNKSGFQAEEKTGQNFTTQNKDQNNNNNYDEITYTQEQSDEIDSVFSSFNLSENDLETIKKISADTNPDPENKEGNECGSIDKKCEWCGNFFTESTYYMTYQSLIKEFNNPLMALAVNVMTLFTSESDKKEIVYEINKMCENFRQGNKYECGNNESSNYCSKKCEWEAKNH